MIGLDTRKPGCAFGWLVISASCQIRWKLWLQGSGVWITRKLTGTGGADWRMTWGELRISGRRKACLTPRTRKESKTRLSRTVENMFEQFPGEKVDPNISTVTYYGIEKMGSPHAYLVCPMAYVNLQKKGEFPQQHLGLLFIPP